MSGVQVPPPLPKNFNEIDLIYQSHLIYSEIRIRFYTLICQSVCDQCVTEGGLLCPIERIETQDQGPRTGDPVSGVVRLGPRAFSISVLDPFGGGFVW